MKASDITVAAYRYFSKHKFVMYLTLIATLGLFGVLSSKIYLEEDIAKLVPATDTGSGQLAFSDLKVKDRITVIFEPESEDVDPYTLTDACDEFFALLEEVDTTHRYVGSTLYMLDEGMLTDAVDYMLANLPAYIESDDYARIDSLLTSDNVAKTMTENYDMLLSEMGSLLQPLITHDPIGLRKVLMQRFATPPASGNEDKQLTLVNNHLFTGDASICQGYIFPSISSSESGKNSQLVAEMEEVISRVREDYPDVRIGYSGAPIQSAFNSTRIKRDLVCTIGVALLIICFTIAFCFRNKSTIPLLVMPVIYGSLFALGMVYLIKGKMSLMVLGLGAVVVGVALSYCLHILTHTKYVEDPIQILHDQTRPVVLGALTTIGSFMGLLLTKSELLQDFGFFAAFEIIGTTIFCLFYLPHFFSKRRTRRSRRAFMLIDRINSYPFDRQPVLVWGIVAMSIVCIVASRNLTFDSDLKNIGYTDPGVQRTMELLASKSPSGCTTTYFAATSADADSAITHAHALAATLDALKANGLLHSYTNPSELLVSKATQRERIAAWNSYWDEERLAKVRTLIEEQAPKAGLNAPMFAPFYALATGDHEPNYIFESEALPAMLRSIIVEKSNDKYMIFFPVQVSKEQLIPLCDAVNAASPHFLVVDPYYYTGQTVKLINDDFNTALYIAMAFVFVVLLASFRSMTLALIAFLPMALSWYIVIGLMALTGMQFNLINIVVSTFIFGIGVDYSIFIMEGLLAKHRGTGDLLLPHKSAIVFSAFVLLIGVGSLFFAVHPAIRSVGLVTIIGMVSTVVISYALQPYLFRKVYVKMQERKNKM